MANKYRSYNKARNNHLKNVKIQRDNEELIMRIAHAKSSLDHSAMAREYEQKARIKQKLCKNPKALMLPPIKRIHGISEKQR